MCLHQLPRYKNFKGVIHELGQNQYLVSGEVSVLDKNTIEIIELPVRTWTQVTCGRQEFGFRITGVLLMSDVFLSLSGV